ncbi:hypothetical protein ACFWJ4_21785 [Kitasatospora sp. NPDC127067]|uniref:hypothetical protein n=1 Tax=Kitasatospora sp. NPDC127067 TaxID=3347126 RepID=UPI003665DC94
MSPEGGTTSTHHVDFHPVVVTAVTEHGASRRILASPHLRIVRADQVRSGDLIVSAFQTAAPGRLPPADYFASGPYPASPGLYYPDCGCGVCGLPEVQGRNGTVVLSTCYPWDTCDQWPTDDPVLIRPRRRLRAPSPMPRPDLP